MAKRKQNPQLNIFEVPTVSFEEDIWGKFKIEIAKLKKQGFSSICEGWWRSRFYETLVCPGHSSNKLGFEYQTRVNQCWRFIWQAHQTEITRNT